MDPKLAPFLPPSPRFPRVRGDGPCGAGIWVVSAEVPDDLVYSITRSLWHDGNRHILDQGHPMGQKIRLQSALEGVVIPLHPGAERFYKEAGMQIPEEANKNN